MDSMMEQEQEIGNFETLKKNPIISAPDTLFILPTKTEEWLHNQEHCTLDYSQADHSCSDAPRPRDNYSVQYDNQGFLFSATLW